MSLDLLSAFDSTPDAGDVVDAELAVTDDILVEAFAHGPDASIDPHAHPDSTNVFHVVRGTVTVFRDGEEATISAPGVVLNEQGRDHGARNEGGEVPVVTASLCPLPQ